MEVCTGQRVQRQEDSSCSDWRCWQPHSGKRQLEHGSDRKTNESEHRQSKDDDREPA